jgi:MFS family permease
MRSCRSSDARRRLSEAGRPWRLVFGSSLLVGIVQVAMIRELSAYHALASVDLSIRLVVAVVIAAYGLGAALSPLIRRLGEARVLAGLGGGMAVYLVALLIAALWWLEPQLAARAVDAPRLLVLGLLVSPPFVACGMVVAHVTRLMQQRCPARIGAFIGLSLVGTLAGVVVSHHYAQWIGVNSLLVLAAGCSLPLLLDRPLLAAAVALLVTAVPPESWLEAQRENRPAFYQPVSADNTTRVFSGWSPHQKVDLYTFRNEVLLGCYNGFWQWWTAARTDHPNAFPGYDLLYDAAWMKGSDVLVIGSGAGMGLLHLEESQPRSITAVELDPLVVKLARDRFSEFNDRIYDRVDVYAMDGRSFLEATDQQFAAIIYEGSFLTAAHPKVAVSVENYLYTREGMGAALDRLRPEGLGIVLFAGPTRAFDRVREAIESHAVPVAALQLSYQGTLWRDLPALVFSRSAERVEQVFARVLSAGGGRKASAYSLAAEADAPISDARPFLYAGAEGELAFMLVQYGLVSMFRSFFGDPVSTAYAVVLLLLGGMAIGSARLPAFLAWPRVRRWGLAAVALSISCAALGWLPLDLAFQPAAIRLLVAALVVLPGAVLLGVFFPLGLRDQPPEAVTSAYVFDALGTVVGFLLFYLIALGSGIPLALVAGGLVYTVAWGLLPRMRDAG